MKLSYGSHVLKLLVSQDFKSLNEN